METALMIGIEHLKQPLTVVRARAQLAQRHLADGDYEKAIEDLIAIEQAERRCTALLNDLAMVEHGRARA